MNYPVCEPLVIWARARREETHRTAGRRLSPGRNGGTAPTPARAADELAASAVPVVAGSLATEVPRRVQALPEVTRTEVSVNVDDSVAERST